MPKRGARRRKTRTHKEATDEEIDEAPKSFILKRGKVSPYTRLLLSDMRALMYPYTATNLKESRKNSLKDFISVAGLYGVTHMLIFTQTEKSNYLRFIKNPKGPTMTFKIEEYALAKDVVKYMQANKKHSKIFSQTLQAPPLLIMNGFQQREENDCYKMASVMVQSLFPPIKVQNLNLTTCKLVVLFNLEEDEKGEYMEFRHYGLSARQRDINRGLKRMINNKKAPNLAKYNDIADFVMT